jgi:hypothetical protein
MVKSFSRVTHPVLSGHPSPEGNLSVEAVAGAEFPHRAVSQKGDFSFKSPIERGFRGV